MHFISFVYRENNLKVKLLLMNFSSNHRDVSIQNLARRKRENYLSALPDAIPFLAETAENEDPPLEAACRALVKYMQEAFGQSLDGFFE